MDLITVVISFFSGGVCIILSVASTGEFLQTKDPKTFYKSLFFGGAATFLILLPFYLK